MWLVERVAGGVVYITLLLVVCNGIFVSRPSSVRRWLVFYAFALAVLGFVYIPPETADLYRITEYMHAWATLTPSQLVERCAQSTTPVYIAYFWFIGQFGVDGLLPASSALIYHLLVFSCLWDYARREDVSTRNVALALAVLMSFGSFLQVISGIRSYLAFAIIVHCIYREVVCGRPVVLSIPGYVLAALMHSAGLAFVAARLLVMLFQRGSSPLQRLFSILFVGWGALFAARYGMTYVDSMLDHAAGYLTHEVYSYVWEYLIHGVLVVVLVVTYRRARLWAPEVTGARNLLLISGILCVVSVVSAPFEYSIFLRFTGAAANLAAPLVMTCLEREDAAAGALSQTPARVRVRHRLGKGGQSYRWLLLAASAIMLFLACARGDLCGYKFMVL